MAYIGIGFIMRAPALLKGEKMSNTRERILMLLVNRPYAIDELAREISVTKNAVRAQIALLQREGIVEVRGVLKSARRPAALYGLSPDADVYFSKAYPVVLSHLVQVLKNRLPSEEFKKAMEELGRGLAASAPRPSGDPQERIQAALEFLRNLGSLGRIRQGDGKVILTSPVCPIAKAVAADARVCIAMETLLHELTGLPVKERCDRGEHQSCQFIVKMPRRASKQ